MKKNVMIVFGGKSYEHDISIVSTFQCLRYFDEYLYNIYLVYIDKKGIWRYVKNSSFAHFKKHKDNLPMVQLGINENVLYVKKNGKYKRLKNIDFVFPIMHGMNGEDGAISAIIKMSNYPYSCCDNESSVIGIDKGLFKKCMDDNICIPYMEILFDEFLLDEEKVIEKIAQKIGFPCIIKPGRLGSSIGIELCKNKQDLSKILQKTFKFDKKMIIEKYLSNIREFNIALFYNDEGVIYSEIEEPIIKDNILSFDDKYLTFSGENNSKNIPAKISKKLRNSIIEIAKNAYLTMNCFGIVRMDFIYDKNNKLYLNEVNTIPGSIALYLFEASGIDGKEVVNSVIKEGIRRYHNENDKQISYESNILKSQNLNKFN